MPDLTSAVPDLTSPVLGRPSPAADTPPRLRGEGDAATAAYRADAGDTPEWSLRAASVAGVRHRLAGQGVEDAYAWRVGDGFVVAAVADGVGTTAAAAGAARAAVVAACRAAADSEAAVSDRERCGRAVAAANAAVGSGEGATTLVVVVARAGGACSLGRVGDSTAAVLVDGALGDVFAVPASAGEVDEGELSTTATAALPSTPPATEEAAVSLEPGAAILIVTDGLANPWRDGPTTVAPAFVEGLAEPPSPIGLAALVDFSRQGCFDDRTIVGLWRAAPSPPQAGGDPAGVGDATA